MMGKSEPKETDIKESLIAIIEEVFNKELHQLEVVKNLRDRVRILEEQMAMVIEDMGNE